jgi:hypothetical protein
MSAPVRESDPQGVTECPGQQLTTLPEESLTPELTLEEAAAVLLRGLTRLRAHVFFMRLDYQRFPGLPCIAAEDVPDLTRKYQR